MKNIINNKHNEQGSALLMTLGVLALALILAMSFAFSSRTDRQVSKANADQVKSRLLAESSLERVIAALKHNCASKLYPAEEMLETSEPDDKWNFLFTSAVPASNWQTRYLVSKQDNNGTLQTNELDDFDKLLILGHHQDFLPITEFFDEDYFPKKRGYQNITDSNGEIIGRIAFLVVEEANKIDINQALTLRMTTADFSDNRPFVKNDKLLGFINESIESITETFENNNGDFLYDITGEGLVDCEVDENNTIRAGLHFQELRLNDDFLSKLLDAYPGDGANSTGTRIPWFSYSHLWNTLWNPDLTAPRNPSTDTPKYTFFSGEDIEAYWDDSDKVERQRFDITGFEWGNSSKDSYIEDPDNHGEYIPNPEKSGWYHDGTLGGAQDLVDDLVDDDEREEFYTDSNTREALKSTPKPGDNGFGIPYLNKLEGITTNLGKQIAANMVDFCDGDSWATKPSGVTWSSTDEPEYVGNEKVPYFNEVAFKAIAEKSNVQTEPEPYRFTLRLVPSVELVNIFPDETLNSRDFRLRVIGSYNFKKNPSSTDEPFDLSFDFSAKDIAPCGYHDERLSDNDPKTVIHSETSLADITVAEYTLTIEKIILISGSKDDDNKICDFGYWEGTVNTTLIPDTPLFDDQYACLEAKDPRINHRPDNWTWKTSETPPEVFGSDKNNNTLGDNNSNFKPQNSDPDSDKECITGISPPPEEALPKNYPLYTFSTAFIPNRPFRNFWELGAIHRGEAFRTLDIADIDVELLDQLKIGPLKKTYGKFNVNSKNPAAFAELLKNIDITEGYDDISDAGPAYSTPSSLGGAVSRNRGIAFANIINDSGLILGASNDREREAFIGRTANLLTTRVDKYSILVVGQALQLLVGVANVSEVEGTVANPIGYGGNVYSILATQRIIAHVVRDAWRNSFEIVQQRMLEE